MSDVRKRFAIVWEGLFEKKHQDQLGDAWILYGKLICYADYKTGVLYAKHSRLAEETKLSVSTIKNYLKTLTKYNYIVITRNSHNLGIQITNWTDVRAWLKSLKKDLERVDVIAQNRAVIDNKSTSDSQFFVNDRQLPRLQAPLTNKQINKETYGLEKLGNDERPIEKAKLWEKGSTVITDVLAEHGVAIKVKEF